MIRVKAHMLGTLLYLFSFCRCARSALCRNRYSHLYTDDCVIKPEAVFALCSAYICSWCSCVSAGSFSCSSLVFDSQVRQSFASGGRLELQCLLIKLSQMTQKSFASGERNCPYVPLFPGCSPRHSVNELLWCIWKSRILWTHLQHVAAPLQSGDGHWWLCTTYACSVYKKYLASWMFYPFIDFINESCLI